jgi:hypothetical protein
MIQFVSVAIVFGLMYAFVTWWSATNKVAFVGLLWIVASLLCIALCVAVAVHDRELDWWDWTTWVKVVLGSLFAPWLWLRFLMGIRQRPMRFALRAFGKLTALVFARVVSIVPRHRQQSRYKLGQG